MFLSTAGLVLSLSMSLQSAVSRPATQKMPVHVVLVNMSGNLREIHVGQSLVRLPVGQRVPLTVPNGSPLEVSSATDSKVDRTILVQQRDEGATIPVR